MPHPSLRHLDHRPWPLPEARWTWRQSWVDLLFAHWPVDAARLRPLVPEPLVVQEHGGTSWIGLVPFRMTGVMHRPLPDVPWVSAFPELNVRLYVEHEGKPGVFFLSLDATNPLAVWAARRFFHLPYYRAAITLRESEGTIHYVSRRMGRRPDGEPSFEAFYRPTSAPYRSRPGTLEHFLTERYCLYARAPDGSILRNDVHHEPWPLQAAEATIVRNGYFAPHGLEVPGPPATLHFARRIDVVVWDAERVVAAAS